MNGCLRPGLRAPRTQGAISVFDLCVHDMATSDADHLNGLSAQSVSLDGAADVVFEDLTLKADTHPLPTALYTLSNLATGPEELKASIVRTGVIRLLPECMRFKGGSSDLAKEVRFWSA
jgi:hypothetical protein